MSSITQTPSNKESHTLNDIISSNGNALQILNNLILDKKLSLDDINEAQKKGSDSSISNHEQSNNSSTTESTAENLGNKQTNNSNVKTLTKSEKKRKKLEKKQQKEKVEYMTRHIAFRFHYDGSTYNGLAENRNCITDNSVEKVLFAALEKTCLVDSLSEKNDGGLIVEKVNNDGSTDGKNGDTVMHSLDDKVVKRDLGLVTKVGNTRDECKYSRSGRTDKGVSAFGQVIALRVRSAFPVGTMIPRNADETSTKESEKKSGGNEDLKPMEESDMPPNSLGETKCWVPLPPPPVSQKKRKRSKNRKREEANEHAIRPMKERVIREKSYCQILNNVLPPSVRMLGWSPISNEFSARFSTSSRTYRYFFIRRDLNLVAMQKALDNMVGKHDFRNLCKMNCEEVDNFVRVVNYAKIVQTATAPISDDGDEGLKKRSESVNYRRSCFFEIQGQAFLWHQIRCIASLLFMVGKGHESPSVVNELLDIKVNPAKPSYPFAPELPLVLHKCDYRNLKFGHTVQNLWRVSCDLETKWEELTLAAERIRNGMDSLGIDALVSSTDAIEFITTMVEERRKKMSRNNALYSNHDLVSSKVDLSRLQDDVGSKPHISWNEVQRLIHKYGGGHAGIEGPKVRLHVPLMQRSRGTTYEEKIRSIMAIDGERSDGGPPSKRRREVYENNMKKKKLSSEEEATFYNKMLDQGGSGL